MNTNSTNIEPLAYMLPSSGKCIRLPDRVALNACRFQRRDDDLILVTATHTQIILRRYYTVEKAPYLRDSQGDLLSGDLARLLAGLSDTAVNALMKRSQRRGDRAG
ncbi:MAG: hypothetical protein HOH04_06360 [Rhodospirillaceae bacterium]|nr:hypothetical protein [Rhodospirillaceae bacterium]